MSSNIHGSNFPLATRSLLAILPRDPTVELIEAGIIIGLIMILFVSLVVIWRSSHARRWLVFLAWITGICSFSGISLFCLFPPVARVREASARINISNNMKQIALAMHSYADSDDGKWPPPAIFSKEGRPLLSWRVLLLPYLEENELYRQFHLDESWDSPHNLTLLQRMPSEYAPHPGLGVKVEPLHTFFQVFVGKGTAFEGKTGLRREDFPGGLSNTILIAEAGTPVPWTKPEDLVYETERPLSSLGGLSKAKFNGFYVALGDGSVRFIGSEVSEATLRAAITRNENRFLGPDW